MPKRRMRTAAQIAASRRNLEKARAAKASKIPREKYRGKSITLYHRTTPANARSILKSQKFDSLADGRPRQSIMGYKPAIGLTFFSTDPGTNTRYGKSVLKVVVPVRVNRKLKIRDDPNFDRELGFKYVRNADLAGRKIKRHRLSRGGG